VLVQTVVKSYLIDPLSDPRWPGFIERHPNASVFHTRGWLQALRRTYGYLLLASTTASPEGELRNGVVSCWARSRLTGSKLVSLPFSDHCEPLLENHVELEDLIAPLRQEVDAGDGRYLEIRPLRTIDNRVRNLTIAGNYCLHELDLRPEIDAIFEGFHKNCIQRKIRRADREALRYEAGRSGPLLRRFYELVVLTRQRQRLLPQPFAWFRNLVESMGNMLEIHLASKGNQSVAAILTLRFKDTLVFKYGASDKRLSNLGGTPMLFWRVIQQAKRDGLLRFDLGRSDLDTAGLLTFKDRLGARRSLLSYWRYHSASREPRGDRTWLAQFPQYLSRHLPAALLPSFGRLMYRHYA